MSYAAWMVHHNNGGTQHPPTTPDQGWLPSDGLARGPVRYTWGNAGDWNISAANAGFAVDRTPRVGSIASGSTGLTAAPSPWATSPMSPPRTTMVRLTWQYNLREDSRLSTLHLPLTGATDTSNGHGPFYVSYPDHFLHIHDSFPAGQPYQVTGVDSQARPSRASPRSAT